MIKLYYIVSEIFISLYNDIRKFLLSIFEVFNHFRQVLHILMLFLMFECLQYATIPKYNINIIYFTVGMYLFIYVWKVIYGGHWKERMKEKEKM
jgi:hypothetical protein